MFSKACEYGIRAAVYVALRSLEGERASVGEIAEGTGSPTAFTAKVLQQLARGSILDSARGPGGGFRIGEQKMATVTLGEIVAAIDGGSIYEGCALGLDRCSAERPCPLHDRFVGIRDDLKLMLGDTSLYELATGLKQGKAYLK